MYVYLQAYERYTATPQPLVAFVSFYRGQAEGDNAASGVGWYGPKIQGAALEIQSLAIQAFAG